jgi:hypothetical protein
LNDDSIYYYNTLHNSNNNNNDQNNKLMLLACQKVVHGRPHSDIQAAVRSMYLRDAVYLTKAGLGYVDFVVWCRFPIHPLDPVMFYHDCNHIMPEVVEEENEADNLESIEWAQNDEVSFVLVLKSENVTW